MANTASAPRRFTPQLIESSTSSSSSSSSSSQPKRRFVPELVESTSRHSGQPENVGSADRTKAQASSPPRRRFAPEPIETTTRSSKPNSDPQAHESPHSSSPAMTTTISTPAMTTTLPTLAPSPVRRKFTPQLIETAVRSRKAGDMGPAVLEQDKTKYSPADPPTVPQRPTLSPPVPKNTPRNSASKVPTVLKPWPVRQGSIRPHYNTRSNTRQHSYRVPDLEDIESSESGDSHAPSLSRSNSATSDSDDDAYKHATRMRESVDDRFSGYLLALAARAAEKQLRDQEAAAFANSDFHQPVAHYVDDDASEEEIISSPEAEAPLSTRRDSMDDKFALEEMRRHGERLSKEKQNKAPDTDSYNGPPARKKTGAAFNVEFDGDVNQTAWMTPSAPKNIIGGYQRDPDLKQMRKAASPPMLGGDLEFPRCPSPEHARFDVTQGSDFLKASMCYLTEQGMWGGAGSKKTGKSGGTENCKQSQSSCWSGSSASSSSKAKGGLWGGFCTPNDVKVIPQPSSGLVTPLRTPQVEKEDPFSMFSSGSVGATIAGKRPSGPPGDSVLPPSPPASNSGAVEAMESTTAQPEAACEGALQAELDKEFSNAFVTQVFNYLSLGYPALARKFDDELSRITRVPVETLRLDDKLAEGGARGYLRLEDDGTDAEQGVEESDCQRWLALRIYVRQWAKQIIIARRAEGGGKDKDPHSAWGLPAGLPARKGSWGL